MDLEHRLLAPMEELYRSPFAETRLHVLSALLVVLQAAGQADVTSTCAHTQTPAARAVGPPGGAAGRIQLNVCGWSVGAGLRPP